MQPNTRIFLDGGDPNETRQADIVFKGVGFRGIEGQTTNPSLIVKNLSGRLGGRKLTQHEALSEYRRVVEEMARVTSGPVSIQVIADAETPAEAMLAQARERIHWIPNAAIKFPVTKAGLAAASVFCHEGQVNMTLTFSQSQAAAVYEATRGATHPVYVSPFVGRLDDKGEYGMDVIANILSMYRGGDGHVAVLTASIRSMDHLYAAIAIGSDIATIPYGIAAEWAASGCALPAPGWQADRKGLAPIPYRTEISLGAPWESYDISHPLTDAGMVRFWSDWHSIIA